MERKTGAAFALLLLAAVVVAYLPALQAGFVWNDHTYVTENPTLDGASGLRLIWLDTRANEQYYPLVFTSYWLEKRLWGLDPFGYHLVNVLLHAGASLLFWRLLRRLRLPAAGLAAAAFALHPVCVESVAWVTERKNTLSLVLTLAAALAWLSWRDAVGERVAEEAPRNPKRKRRARPEATSAARPGLLYAASLGAFTLALLAKTTASVLPAVLLVLLWWKEGRKPRARVVRSLLPHFAIGVGLSLHTAWLERTMVRATGGEWAHGLADRLALAGQVTAFYAGKIVFPAHLSFIYERWTLDAARLKQWVPTVAVGAALAGAAMLARRGRRGPLASLLLFGGVLFPAMGFFNVYAMRYSWVADHFAYQAVAVAAAALVCGAAVLLRERRPAWMRPAAAAGVAGLCLLGTLSFRQARPYRSAETLWLDSIRKNAGCFICETNYGNLLLEAGRTAEAKTHLERSLAIKPDAVPTLLNLARIAEEAALLDEASRHLVSALAVDPTDTEVRVHLGTIRTREGRFDDAIREFQAALAIPSSVDFLAHNGLGVALVKAGRIEEGIGHLRECVRLRPDYEHGRANLAAVLGAARRRLSAAHGVPPVRDRSPGPVPPGTSRTLAER